MSSKQFVVIGLGNSGYFLARHLTALGHDVLVIDSSPEKIQDITASVSQAVVADSTRKKQMASLPLNKVDSVVVCIGEDLEASLLTVLNLKELGVKHIIAKSSSPAHTVILEKLGVSDIFHPERDMAISLAERMNRPNMLDYLPFMEGFSIIELACPEKFIGKTLKDLSLTKKYGVQVIAIRDPLETEPKLGNLADYVLQERDVLFIIGPNKVLDKIKD
ncbi:MAG TPA: TrkA family potassium uptake protein [Fibrobacteraceae bacterium]|jgi:trk system potassium uptake protein TrkA|nr:TrkA family potassium uptake protein [Fibrobacteraceae bacterium]